MNQKNIHKKPPWVGEWLLRSFCSYDFLNTALWDMEEIYIYNLEQKGKNKAKWLYLKEAVGVIYHLYFRGKSHYATNNVAMVKNNIIVALRSIKKNKGNGLVNIIGLSAALILFLLTTLYTSYEFSFDSYHEDSDNIYRIYKSVNTIGDPDYRDSGTPGPLADALTTEFPSIISATRIRQWRKIILETENKTFVEPEVYPADPSIFSVFSFEPVSGKLDDFIVEPFTMAISETTALKYFNRTDVIGESITFNSNVPMTISGVFKDMPENSSFRLDVVINLESIMNAYNENMTRWGNNPFFTYIKTQKNIDIKTLEAQLTAIRTKYANDPMDEDGQEYTYFLQSLKDVHFEQKILGSLGTPVNGQRLQNYFIISIIILIMACVNYVNLATAQSIVKMKEVGIRKAIGAKRANLVAQFMITSGIVVFFAVILATLIIFMALPAFANFVERPLELQFFDPKLWLFLTATWFGLTLVSGLYPALMASKFNPLQALSGHGYSANRSSVLRKGLVVFQFAISIMLIVAAIVLVKQLRYIDNLDVGYSREKIVILSTRDDAVDNRLGDYMEELRKVSGVSTVATSWSLPTNVTSNTQANWNGITDAERLPMYMVGVNHDFFDLYDIEVIEGRAFDKEIKSDRNNILLNETAVKELGWENPIGREMITQAGVKAQVIGVVKDFHIKSLRDKIEPLQILLSGRYATLAVKINADLYETLVKIEDVYESFSPVYPFEYRLFEDVFDNAYAAESKMAKLAFWITILAISIACLGLYGLASHRVEQMVKELGVRKVMGASTNNLLSLLSFDFLKLLGLSFLLAGPIAYYFMNLWLEGFAYHTQIGLMSFVLALVLIAIVAILAIGYRTYTAAVGNPVDALRQE
ncbi:ABC transporter permease [Roseivirga sp.]|uniref:ABC transporter permease n=1 Tax=Roseivirga sp. TaxID=1964215 RepID=UPI003B8E0724